MDTPGIDLSPLRKALGMLAADAGLVQYPNAWRLWRELRNATSYADGEPKAEQVARDAERFHGDACTLLAALEAAL